MLTSEKTINDFDARRKSLTLFCATSMLQPAAEDGTIASTPSFDGPTLAEDALRGPRLASIFDGRRA